MDNLTIAIAKGRIEKDIYRRLEALNMEKWIDRDSRKLIFTDEENHITYIHVKPSDVVTYVEKGVADLGIVGKDTILENENESEVYELYDLGFGKCKFSVAGMKGKKDRKVCYCCGSCLCKYRNACCHRGCHCCCKYKC